LNLRETFSRHWFPAALIVLFFVGILVGAHGTSVGEWDRIFPSKTEAYSFPHIGSSRAIRVDDWCVSQPFVFAQCASEDFFPRINAKVNGGMDMFLQTPCAPVWDWTVPGQFHNWGYFAFGAERGSSWSWWVRYVGLPFFAYLFLLSWCKGDRLVAVAGSLGIVLGAPSQWWDTTMPYHLLYFFAVLVMASVVCGARRRRSIVAGGLGLCVALLSYVFVMYPPFELLLLPALAVLFAFVVRERFVWDHGKWRILVFCGVGISIVADLCYFFTMHREALEVIANSAYPGARVCHGGNLSYVCQRALLDLVSLLSWWGQSVPPKLNECQAAEYVSLMLPTVCAFILIVRRNRRVDCFELLLLLYSLVCLLWLATDWPVWLARYTGFYLFPIPRVSVIQGFVTLVLSLRVFKEMSEDPPRPTVGIGCALVLVCLAPRLFCLWQSGEMRSFFSSSDAAFLRFAVALLLVAGIWMSFLYGKRAVFASLMLLYAGITGLAVHPMAVGQSPLHDKELVELVRELDAEKPGTWWSNDRCVAQLPLALGLRNWAGTQQYSNHAFWNEIDPSHAYEHVWNRYGHRFATVLGKHKFENRGRPDCIYYGVTVADLQALGVDYVIWRGACANKIPGMTRIARVGRDSIYRIVHKDAEEQ